MANKEALDRVRARLAREEREEAERRENHPAKQELQGWRRRMDEEARRAEEMRKQEREVARRERGEAEMQALKTELRNAYLGAGGDPEGYEAAWPSLRDREISRRTLERAEKARRQVQADYESSF